MRRGCRTIDLRGLRELNAHRCSVSFGHGVDGWSETDWACAVAGEAGELCNLIKKRRRGDDIGMGAVADEIADVVIYLDLLAARLGIDLGDAIAAKFNAVSGRVGYTHGRLFDARDPRRLVAGY